VLYPRRGHTSPYGELRLGFSLPNTSYARSVVSVWYYNSLLIALVLVTPSIYRLLNYQLAMILPSMFILKQMNRYFAALNKNDKPFITWGNLRDGKIKFHEDGTSLSEVPGPLSQDRDEKWENLGGTFVSTPCLILFSLGIDPRPDGRLYICLYTSAIPSP
jgi:hypothetical protein